MPPAPEAPAADLAYSLALGGAIAAAVAAWVLRVVARGAERLLRWGRLAAVAAMVLIAQSLAVHLAFGHPPGSPRALGPWEFVSEHPAGPVVAAAALLAWRARRSGRSREG